jgi:outer membrane protein assembly factor BamA
LKKLIHILTFFSLGLSAQLKQDTSKNARFLIIPVIMRTPETGWGYGGSANVSFRTTHRKDTLTRVSTIDALAIFTERGQNIQGIEGTLYFPKEKFIGYFQGYHVYFPDQFWGVGPDTKDEWHEKYVYEHAHAYLHIKRKIIKRLFAGIIYDYQNVFRLSYNKGAVFDTTFFAGKNPYAISGIGLSLSYDTRNATFWPTKGVFIQSHFTQYDKLYGSNYSFYKWLLELRVFKKVFKDHVIAAQINSNASFGQTPFRSMAVLGGQGNLRGFYQGRFRDNNLITFIGEYRAPIYWRFSLVAFGGIGNVYDVLPQLQSHPLLYSFGGGIRLALLEKDKLNIRIDYGYYNTYNSGFYFTLGECF